MECLCIVCVGVSVCTRTQLINTSAGINTYKPPDSILGIDLSLFLCALPLSPSFSNVLMMHTLRTQAHLTLCMGGHPVVLLVCTRLCFCVCVCVWVWRLGQWRLGCDGGSLHAANHLHHTRQSKHAFQLLLTILGSWWAASLSLVFYLQPRLLHLFKRIVPPKFKSFNHLLLTTMSAEALATFSDPYSRCWLSHKERIPPNGSPWWPCAPV